MTPISFWCHIFNLKCVTCLIPRLHRISYFAEVWCFIRLIRINPSVLTRRCVTSLQSLTRDNWRLFYWKSLLEKVSIIFHDVPSILYYMHSQLKRNLLILLLFWIFKSESSSGTTYLDISTCCFTMLGL